MQTLVYGPTLQEKAPLTAEKSRNKNRSDSPAKGPS